MYDTVEILVMSPSKAGSSHSSSWRFFSSVRLVTFSTSARNWKLSKNKPRFFFMINLFWKALKNDKIMHFYATKIQMNDRSSMKLIQIMLQMQNWKIWKICYLMMHILSARFQLENWSAPAWLGLARNLHSSAQLELENSSSGSSLRNTHAKEMTMTIYPLTIFKSKS